MKTIGTVGPSRYSRGGTIVVGYYHDGSIALQITGMEGMEGKATVCLAPEGPTAKEGFCWLKGWSENEGLPEALEKAGIVKRTGETYPVGFPGAGLEAELAEIIVT